MRETATAKLRRIIRPAGIAVSPGLGIAGASSFGFLADEHQVVVGLGNPLTISLCNLESGKSRRALAAGGSLLALAIVVSPRGHLAVTAPHDNAPTLWDAQKGKALTRLPGIGLVMPTPGMIQGSLVFAPDETALAGIDINGNVTVWDLKRWLTKTGPEPQAADHDPGVDTPRAGPAGEETPAAERKAKAKPAAAARSAPSPQFRTWTSADGRFTIDAEFVKAIGRKVTLRKRDGTEITVPMERLSEDDRRVILGR